MPLWNYGGPAPEIWPRKRQQLAVLRHQKYCAIVYGKPAKKPLLQTKLAKAQGAIDSCDSETGMTTKMTE